MLRYWKAYRWCVSMFVLEPDSLQRCILFSRDGRSYIPSTCRRCSCPSGECQTEIADLIGKLLSPSEDFDGRTHWKDRCRRIADCICLESAQGDRFRRCRYDRSASGRCSAGLGVSSRSFCLYAGSAKSCCCFGFVTKICLSMPRDYQH
jgi:hypothetical protein